MYTVSAQTYVPDDAFEQSLINLGYDDVLDDYVTTSNIENIEDLSLPSLPPGNFLSINDLTGLEDFTGLKSLNLRNVINIPSALNLSTLVLLEELAIDGGRINALNLTNNTELTSLSLEHLDALLAIDISSNTKLKEIHINELELRTLDFSNQPALESIFLATLFGVRALDLSNNPELTAFEGLLLSLNELDFSNNTKLEKAVCDRCTLTAVNLKNGHNTILTELNFTSNHINCVQIDNLDYAKSQSNWNIGYPGIYSEDCANLDSDNDGVPDTMDDCQSTPIGSIVDENGCPISIADLVLENIQISIGSTPCSVGLSGFIKLESSKNFPLNISIVKENSDYHFEAILNQANPIELTQLEEGDYQILVDAANIPSATTDFVWDVSFSAERNEITTTVAITKPDQTYNLAVAGSTSYEVEVNDTTTTQEFDSSEEQQLEIPLVIGANEIIVTGTIDCEAETQRTYVPDDAFEQSLINLGYDDVLDDYVTTSNIENIEDLSLPSLPPGNFLSINDLTGLEDFTGLKSLNLRNVINIPSALNLSTLVLLEELEIDGGYINSLNLTNNTELTSLSLEHLDALLAIDISSNTKLKEIYFVEVQLRALDLSHLTVLEKLQIYQSDFINTLDLTNNTELVIFDCDQINISKLDFSNCTKLEKVICYLCGITEINLKNGFNTILNELRLGDNISCVQVDDVDYAESQSNWTIYTPAGSYSEDCSSTNSESTDDSGKSTDSLQLFPTLSDGSITIRNSKEKHIQGITVTGLNGVQAKYMYINDNPKEMQVNMKGAAKGMYIIRIQQSEGDAIIKKLLIH